MPQKKVEESEKVEEREKGSGPKKRRSPEPQCFLGDGYSIEDVSVFLQLRLLLWKNFLLRRRNKVRCLVEFLWPLLLFLVLILLRSRALRTPVPQCHLAEKALPSTGTLPFFQSFLCTFNNTCHESEEEARKSSTPYTTVTPGSISTLLEKLSKILSPQTNLEEEKEKITETLSKIKKLKRMSQKLYTASASLGEVPIKHLIPQPKQLYKQMTDNNVNITYELFLHLMNSAINIQHLKEEDLRDFSVKNISVNCSQAPRRLLKPERSEGLLKDFWCHLQPNEASIIVDLVAKQMKSEGTLED